uniref:hypothetical protein n=1 Tax=Bartonella sp. AC134YNZD TaxID=3243446 RepID=UPI0035CEEAB6
MSRLPGLESFLDPSTVNEFFPDEQLFHITSVAPLETPWYADIANYLATGQLPSHWSKLDQKKFLRNARSFFWDEPYLFKYCADQIVRRCIPDSESTSIMQFCHSAAYGGNFSAKKT